MRLPRYIALLILSSVILIFCGRREPSYDHKSLSYWLHELGSAYGAYYGSHALPSAHLVLPSETNEAVLAVRHIGPAALPHLVERMRRHDSRWDELRQNLNRRQSVLHFSVGKRAERRAEAQIALIALGDAAKPVIPQLISLVSDPPLSRDSAAVLRSFGKEGAIALTNAFTNRGDFSWYVACEALRFQGTLWGDPTNDPRVAQFRAERSAILPQLSRIAVHTNYVVALYAMAALADIGGRSALVTNTLNKIVEDKTADRRSRSTARNILRRLAGTNSISDQWQDPMNF